MKKKNISTIKALFIILFLSVSMLINTAYATTSWSFKDSKTGTQVSGFTSEKDCTDNLATYKKNFPSTTFSDCTQATDAPLKYTPAATQPPVLVIPNTNPQAPGSAVTSVYNLLAPIGSLTSIQTSGGTCPSNKNLTNGVGCYLNLLFTLGIGLCAGLAVVMIVIASIQYMGDESIFGKTEAKGKIISAIVGLLIALGSYAILNTISPDLLGSNGVSVDQVNVALQEENITSVGPGVTVSGTHVGIKTGSVAACSGGLVNIPSDIPSTKGGQICKDLLAKLEILKSKNTNWQVTSTLTGKHLSSCHSIDNPKSGNCADIQLTGNPRQGYTSGNGSTNPGWSDLCVALAQINGVNFANEASSAQNCQGIKSYSVYSTTTGPNLHINYIGS